jgi:hypothetical protein
MVNNIMINNSYNILDYISKKPNSLLKEILLEINNRLKNNKYKESHSALKIIKRKIKFAIRNNK